jgi:peptidoglycan/LPS O-acetylase OafA/YrhL
MLAGELASWLGTEGTASLGGRVLHAWSQLPIQLIPVTRLPEFVLGLCLGLLFCRRTHLGRVSWRTAGLLATGAAIAMVIILLPPKPSPLVQMGVLVPLFALFIWLLACGVSGNGLTLGTRPLVQLGGASYALYLLHGSMMGYALALNTRTFSLPHNAVALILVPFAVVISLFLFWFLEEPARHWIRKAPRRAPETRALG